MNYRTAFILIEETISSSVYTLNFKLIAIQYRKSGFFRGISFLAHLTALPLDDRCPSDARSCKHGGRPPGVSRKKKRMPHMICNILFFCVRYF